MMFIMNQQGLFSPIAIHIHIQSSVIIFTISKLNTNIHITRDRNLGRGEKFIHIQQSQNSFIKLGCWQTYYFKHLFVIHGNNHLHKICYLWREAKTYVYADNKRVYRRWELFKSSTIKCPRKALFLLTHTADELLFELCTYH
jgi:hypothetical protein